LTTHGLTVTARQGVPFTVPILKFHDTDRFATASEYTAMVNSSWQVSGSPFGTVESEGNGNFGVLVTGRLDDLGWNYVYLVIRDSSGHETIAAGYVDVISAG